jgi:hypothetical protein
VGLLNNSLTAVSCVSTHFCAAVGHYLAADGAQVLLSEIWNGKKWSIHAVPGPGPVEEQLNAISCVSASFCIAVGDYTPADSGNQPAMAEIWNGTTWNLESIPTPTGFSVLSGISCVSATMCMAAGGDDLNAGSTLVEAWNGKKWTTQTTPNVSSDASDSLSAISCASTTSCVAVGDYTEASQPYKTLAESWDGKSWVIQATPNAPSTTDNYLTGIACPAPGSCIASGYSHAPGESQSMAQMLTGGSWAISPTPNPGNGGELLGVSCASTTSCTAVGGYLPNGQKYTVTLAEHWNGSSWSVQPTDTAGVGVHQETELQSTSCPLTSFCMAAGWNLRFYVSQVTPSRAVLERYLT